MMYPLYIDPGTGSMLFSVLVGLLATLYFVGKAAIIKLKFLFLGKKAKEAALTDEYPIVVYCEGKQYISLFQGIIQELENRKLKTLYLTGEESDPAFQTQYQYVKPEYAGKGNAAFMKLNMISASVVLMTTPGLNVYQLKRSKGVKHYSHILHMASDATMYKLFGLDYFDSVLLSGDYQKADIRTLETMRNIPQKELVTVGCPYLDALQEKFANISPEEKHNFTVLVSPSWGKSAILSRFGKDLLQPLKESGFNIIVRPHPQSKTSEKEVLDSLMNQFPDSETFKWDFEKDNIYSLSKADIMISDFSGIIFDYMFLCDKPFLYVNDDFDLRPYDAYDIVENDKNTKIWQFETLEKCGKRLESKDFSNIKAVIQSMSDSENLANNRKIAKETAWQHIGQSPKLVVDFLESKLGEKVSTSTT